METTVDWIEFQSTPPVWRATLLKADNANHIFAVSIHAPRVEGDINRL